MTSAIFWPWLLFEGNRHRPVQFDPVTFVTVLKDVHPVAQDLFDLPGTDLIDFDRLAGLQVQLIEAAFHLTFAGPLLIVEMVPESFA